MQNPPPAQSTGGVDKRTGATLSYLLWWVTGIIFLFVGKGDPDVKYHAAQSIVLFAPISIIGYALGFTPVWWVGSIVNLIGVILWIVCLYKAWTGNGARFEVPVLGSFISPYANQLAGSV